MLSAWHPSIWRHFCVPEDEKKEIKPFLINKKQYKVANIFSTKINKPIKYQLLNGILA